MKCSKFLQKNSLFNVCGICISLSHYKVSAWFLESPENLVINFAVIVLSAWLSAGLLWNCFMSHRLNKGIGLLMKFSSGYVLLTKNCVNHVCKVIDFQDN